MTVSGFIEADEVDTLPASGCAPYHDRKIVHRRKVPRGGFAAVQDDKRFWVYVVIDCNAIIDGMASITIRNLEETTKRKLKIRAAMHGRSMEQEAREILKSELEKPGKQKTGADLVKRIRAIWEPLGGVELEPYPRQPMRDPEWLKDWK